MMAAFTSNISLCSSLKFIVISAFALVQVQGSPLLQTRVSSSGFTLSGGNDLDGNAYSDLLVGVHDSISYLTSGPLVRVHTKLFFQTDKLISLDNKNCILKDVTTGVACLPQILCVMYDGNGVEPNIDINFRTTLDPKKLQDKDSRMFYISDEGARTENGTMNLQKGTQQCTESMVYIDPNIRDKSTPFEADVVFSMAQNTSASESPRNLVPIDIGRTKLTPRQPKPNVVKPNQTVGVVKNCGSDNICIPDLRLRVTPSTQEIVMGSTDTIWLEVEVHNNREDSYGSALYIETPENLPFVKIDRLDNRKDFSIHCYPLTASTMECLLGNPLPTFAKIRFRVFFRLSDSSQRFDLALQSSMSLNFSIVVNSTDPEDEKHLFDNSKIISIPIRVDTKLKAFGISSPSIIQFEPDFYKRPINNTNDIGPPLIHVYEVKSVETSNIDGADVQIYWPATTSDGKNFLYLLEQPVIEGPGVCDLVGLVDLLGLEISKNNTQRDVLTTRAKRANAEADLNHCSDGFTCDEIKCRIGPLTKSSNSVFIYLRWHVYAETLESHEFIGERISIKSKLLARVTSLPHNMDPSYMRVVIAEIKTEVKDTHSLLSI